jgi:DNA-3-methyladenine glycosylase II
MTAVRPLDSARLRAAIDELAALDGDIAAAWRRIGYPAPRVREPGFATLLRIVVAQQLSTRAAAAIWGRLEAALGGSVTPESFAALGEPELRTVGFSLRKALYARELAAAMSGGALETTTLASLDDDAIVAQIAALRGFGRWSGEVYGLFALGREDCFPADDLALQVAAMRLKGLPSRPSGRRLRELAEPWRPWRGAAALFLWHYYGAATLDEAGR